MTEPTLDEIEAHAAAVSLEYGQELADRPAEHQEQFRRDARVALSAVLPLHRNRLARQWADELTAIANDDTSSEIIGVHEVDGAHASADWLESKVGE